MIWLVLGACNGPDADTLAVDATLATAVPTVATLSWDGGPATVRYGIQGGELDHTIEADGEVQLLGLKADTTYVFEVDTDDASGGALVKTGNVSNSLPGLNVEGTPALEDGYFVTTFLSTVSAAAILDADGDLVWWWLDERPDIQVARAELMLDGSGVVLGVSTNDPTATERYTELIEVSWDGSTTNTIQAADYHHDFFQVSDGVYAYQALTSIEDNGRDVLGDLVVQVDRDGNTTELWNAFDDFPFDAEYADDERRKYWHHANAMDADGDGFLFSMRNLNTIARIDGAGELDWAIGEFGDLTIEGEKPHTVNQHQFQRLDDGLVVFDNGSTADADSRVVEYAIDLDAGTAEEVWVYRPDPTLYNYALGSVARVDDITLISWTTAGRIEQVSADGELLWEFYTDIGAGVGYAEWVPSL